jgi:hypothetical protein
MSLAINVDNVSAVLLADGWHTVADDSFMLDSYEFVCRETLAHGGGDGGICATGFRFLEDFDDNAGKAYRGDNARVSGPLTAILAVIER